MTDKLTSDEQFVLCQWSVDALADDLKIPVDAAASLLEAAWDQGRIEIMGNSMFAGVVCDGRWVIVEGRQRITAATREWQALRAMERQFED